MSRVPSDSDMPSGSPLKILIAADTYPPDVNGAAVFCYRLATAMHARGHEVHVVAARTDSGPSTVEVRPEATIHRLVSHAVPTHPSYRLCFPWRAGPELGRILDEVRPDVVHVQCHYMIGQAAVNQAQRRGIRIVATNHFMPENLDPFLPFPRWFKRIVAKNSWRDMGRIMGRADVVTTPTPLAAAAMRQRAGLDSVLALSNGIDSAHYELADGEDVQRREHPTVLFVGRLAVEKNIDVLIDAVAATRAGAHLEVIGGGEQLESLQQKAREAHVEHRVHFRGHVDDAALREAYLAADVFCQPGTAELQSLVTLEALSASRPVVLANAMALPHLVDDGVNGYLFAPGDAAELAEKLDAILGADDASRQAMGEASHAKAVKHSQDKTMSTFEAIYRGADYAEVAP
ncbi:glycosyltransferase [Zhihengliuella flava]|uniref:D-inositol 3-phosphate glycosyltransferase n=1 Tax=Zhihengliuella flava TaxID=1285193 RepID=A0A931GDX0_9MICC|nr:glycosyltransferase [Zhihengliuella flava]MBG6083868.1 glycosyltransferase involved in cell wall biosynthesis [Zhihengliuella flava]